MKINPIKACDTRNYTNIKAPKAKNATFDNSTNFELNKLTSASFNGYFRRKKEDYIKDIRYSICPVIATPMQDYLISNDQRIFLADCEFDMAEPNNAKLLNSMKDGEQLVLGRHYMYPTGNKDKVSRKHLLLTKLNHYDYLAKDLNSSMGTIFMPPSCREHSTTINFKGRFDGGNVEKSDEDFNSTVDMNYFKLPTLTKKSGEQYTAKPDKTQLSAAKNIYLGNDTICVAPTGTGKTAIANYAISKNLYDEKKTFYTTPLKALSNDKFREFSKIYGKENVGLLTGDIKVRPDAPIVIMTTEIYRNMALDAFAHDDYHQFNDVGTVVFDEAHYLDDASRGKIWEESLMLTPPETQILALSATIGNSGELTDWIKNVQPKGEATLVEAGPKERHVPLVFYNYTGRIGHKFDELITGKINLGQIQKDFKSDNLSNRQKRAIDDLCRAMLNKTDDDDFEPTPDDTAKTIEKLNEIFEQKMPDNFKFFSKIRNEFGLSNSKATEITQLLIDSDTKTLNVSATKKTSNPDDTDMDDYTQLVRDLKEENKLPALIFKFSRKGCSRASRLLSNADLNLTTNAEKDEISKIIKQYQDAGVYLGHSFSRKQLLNGVAPHHAGLLPSYKKLVEDLFAKKLLKVVVATSTLSAGINMPAKTTVITSISHPTTTNSENPDSIFKEKENVPLSANEFHQMTGRAGRRGIDKIGNVVLYNLEQNEKDLAQDLILQAPNPLMSKYSPSYGFLTSYYQNFNDDDLINYFKENTFRLYQAKDEKQSQSALLDDEFKAYQNVLKKEGCLEFDDTTGTLKTTNKGKYLSKLHGYNEITLLNMIYNKKLEAANEFDMAAFAASMAASEDIEDVMDGSNILRALKKLYPSSLNSDIFNIINNAKNYDMTLNSEEFNNGIKTDDGNTSSLGAAVGYVWAKVCDKEKVDNTSARFSRFYDNCMEFREYAKGGTEEGNLYRILSQSTDVLKQIISIADSAMNDYELKDDYKYYYGLKCKSQKALELISKSPVNDIKGIE